MCLYLVFWQASNRSLVLPELALDCGQVTGIRESWLRIDPSAASFATPYSSSCWLLEVICESFLQEAKPLKADPEGACLKPYIRA